MENNEFIEINLQFGVLIVFFRLGRLALLIK
jgi:hypothetical protein